MKYIMVLILAITYCSLFSQPNRIQVKSPDEKIKFTILADKGELLYCITLNNKDVIDSSSLGLVLDNGTCGPVKSLKVDGDRKLIMPQLTRIRGDDSAPYNEILLKVEGNYTYHIEARVFNSGIGFRYLVEKNNNSTVLSDLTTFKLPIGSTVWSQDNINTYEGTYQKQDIEQILKGQLIGPPMTFKLAGNNGYGAVTESELTDFSGMSLLAQGNRSFSANLAGPVIKHGNIITPWRVIMIGVDLNQLVNSCVINDLCPDPDIKLFPKGRYTSWIRPGKSVWSWLAENGDVTLENMKKFSDWAGQLGFQYNLVDEGWAKWRAPGKDKWKMMQDLVNYSKAKGVKIWAWKAYPDRDGDAGIKDSSARIAFFSKCKEVGIAGLKIDFFDSESQEVIKFYQSALKDAAKFQLMLNFHGSNKPTGESKSWPNEMTREGIMGLENSTNWPRHNTTLVFTRFLAGHGDYTPLSFTKNVSSTSLVHQVSTIAAFTSPFMCLGVDPEKLLKSNVFTMVKQIPTVWDQTIILPPSKVGELVVMARRIRREWFLIVLNGEASCSLNLPLDFLGKGKYHQYALKDNLDRTGAIEVNSLCDHHNSIKLNLSPGGGFIGKFWQD